MVDEKGHQEPKASKYTDESLPILKDSNFSWEWLQKKEELSTVKGNNLLKTIVLPSMG